MKMLSMMSLRSLAAVFALCLALSACGGGGSSDEKDMPRTADEFLDAFGSGSCMVQMLSTAGNVLEIRGMAGVSYPAGGEASFCFNRGAVQPGHIIITKEDDATVKMLFPSVSTETLALPAGWAIEFSNNDFATGGVLKHSATNEVIFNVPARSYTGTFSGTYNAPSQSETGFTDAPTEGQCFPRPTSH